jgi:hypothetical protein
MEKDPIAVEFGRRGGLATSKTHTSEFYREMQAKGVQTKLKKKMLLARSIAKNSTFRG